MSSKAGGAAEQRDVRLLKHVARTAPVLSTSRTYGGLAAMMSKSTVDAVEVRRGRRTRCGRRHRDASRSVERDRQAPALRHRSRRTCNRGIDGR